MLFQQIPSETTNYMILGYTIIFGTLGIYLFSLVSRRRNLEKDKEVLEKFQTREES
ncbi:MAG TPA: CcmD family protein [Anaerolineales bacterium]|nr:CcmD family protein [Anaerolineales bacterium]